VLPPGLSDEANGDQKALIEALMQALSAFVDRLNQDEAQVESDTEQKH
jgi:hypothetical protein